MSNEVTYKNEAIKNLNDKIEQLLKFEKDNGGPSTYIAKENRTYNVYKGNMWKITHIFDKEY